jgi:DNA-binding XRE family transcriptional regulator
MTKTHLETRVPELRDPSAPTLYPKGRKCHRCPNPVNRYAKPTGRLLLCEVCKRKRVDKMLKRPDLPTETNGPHKGVRLPKLERIRRKRGLSREKLSKLANVSIQHISALETNKRGAGEKVRKRLARALGVSEWEMEG